MHKKVFKLKNKIQQYDWGSKTAIPSILGLPVPSQKPMAEMWMGAHPKAPSEVEIDGTWIGLDRLISENAELMLGKEVSEKFSGELPFLFKLIAAEKPLSIQAHPDKKRAEEGFERENRLKIPLDAPERNYKDKNHKPEILCAINEFEVLKGFRHIDEIVEFMQKAVPVSLKEEIDYLRKYKDSDSLKRFYSSLMRMEQKKKKEALKELLSNAERYADLDPVYSLVIQLNKFFPWDIGIFSPLLFNRLLLKAGDAIYLPPGEPHAYIKGFGVELMANSDNVLRGGLTHKHVDIDELLNVLNFSYGPAHIITADKITECESIYPTPAEEFLLSVIGVDERKSFLSAEKRSADIIVLIEGKIELKNLEDNSILRLKKGDSVFIPSCIHRYSISGKALIYKASVPL